MAALQHELQLATQPAASLQLEGSPAPQLESALQLDHIHPHAAVRQSVDKQAHETEDANAPNSSAVHDKPASLGWGRVKKIKLAAQAEGSQDVGSKRRLDQDAGACLSRGHSK